MQGQFQRPNAAPTVQYGNPFDVLLDRAYKPQELKRYVAPVVAPAVEAVVSIDICAICGDPKCSCPNRRIIRMKV